jgi:hypothetical protein
LDEKKMPKKQELSEKILSFSYEELEAWIRLRLHGYDYYFAIYGEDNIDLSGFLFESFQIIENKEFRENFLEVLYKLQMSPGELENNKEYIHQLMTLCSMIRQAGYSPACKSETMLNTGLQYSMEDSMKESLKVGESTPDYGSSFPSKKDQSSLFGYMKDSVKINGDIINPIEEKWVMKL